MSAFERELEILLRTGEVADERGVVTLCFRHGVRRKHAERVLARLKSEGIIRLSFRVPSIDGITKPRPIELLKRA